jgi:F0F1-type ATP synthase membrane subunit c/vacuolar-type H+-ATPase subunit K
MFSTFVSLLGAAAPQVKEGQAIAFGLGVGLGAVGAGIGIGSIFASMIQ